MSDMVERVVLALRTYRNATKEIQARKVIEAMREPTSEMRIAGAHVHDQRPSEATAVYQAFIDAALK